jgi:hypothetical protein
MKPTRAIIRLDGSNRCLRIGISNLNVANQITITGAFIRDLNLNIFSTTLEIYMTLVVGWMLRKQYKVMAVLLVNLRLSIKSVLGLASASHIAFPACWSFNVTKAPCPFLLLVRLKGAIDEANLVP